MRRKRNVVCNSPDDSSSSPRHNTISPRSINSDGTFGHSFEASNGSVHTGGNVSLSSGFAGSLIGHDDPTLVHTNIKESSINRNDEIIKSINSGALDSFLTTSYSEEENRDSSGDAQRSKQNLSVDELRQQLVELDRTQDAWKANQQEVSVDTDDTCDMYVKEAGEFKSSSPKKKSFVLHEETIYEEEEPIENDLSEVAPCKSSDLEPNQIQQGEPEVAVNIITNQPQQGKTEVVVNAIANQPQQGKTEVVVNTIPIQPQQRKPVVNTIPIQPQHRKPDFVNSVPNQPQQGETEAVLDIDKRKTDEVAVGVATGIALGSCPESEDSELDFEYPSIDEQYITSKRNEIFTTDTYVEPSDRTVDSTFVDVEDDKYFSTTNTNVETEETDGIIRAVQKRLYDFSSNNITEIPYATDRLEPLSNHPQSTKSRPWIPVGNSNGTSVKSKKNRWKKSQALASKVDTSNDEDEGGVDIDVDQSSNRRRRRRKLCIMNSCLAFLIIAAIICSALFAVELTGSRSSGPSFVIESNENSDSTNTQPTTSATEVAPTEIFVDLSPIENPTDESSLENSTGYSPSENGTTEELPVENQIPSGSPSAYLLANGLPVENFTSEPPVRISTNAPSRYPIAESLPNENPTEENYPIISPTLYPGSTEARLKMISGDAIYNISAPQYIAYDWMLNKDPATLDLNSLTEHELYQRYIVTLFYFSLNGDNWIEQYGFLEESHVCEWNNGSFRNMMGVICDSSKKITGFAISKYKGSAEIPIGTNDFMHRFTL